MKNSEFNFEHAVNENPFLIVVLGDFNARMQCRYQNIMKGLKINMATSHFSFTHIIKEPILILSNSASCIGLIFISQPKLMNFGVHRSLHPNCHHCLCIIQPLNFLSFTLQTFSLVLSARKY